MDLEKLLRNMCDKDAIFRPTARHVLKMPLIRIYRSQCCGMVDEQMIDAKEKERLTKLRSGARIFRVEEGSLLTQQITNLVQEDAEIKTQENAELHRSS